MELERANSKLRLEVTASQASARSTMEEAVRLLSESHTHTQRDRGGGYAQGLHGICGHL